MLRKIHSDAIKMLDKLIATNPAAQESLNLVSDKSIFYSRQLFVEVAKACLGIHEIPPNLGREVELFQKTVSIPQGSSWCMAFIQTCIAYVEEKTGITSQLVASGLCTKVWNDSPLEQRVKQIPLAGAIAIWRHENAPVQGHTGIVLDCDGVTFHAIEGNASKGDIDLNGTIGTGQGVRLIRRHHDLFNVYSGDLLLLGYLKPF